MVTACTLVGLDVSIFFLLAAGLSSAAAVAAKIVKTARVLSVIISPLGRTPMVRRFIETSISGPTGRLNRREWQPRICGTHSTRFLRVRNRPPGRREARFQYPLQEPRRPSAAAPGLAPAQAVVSAQKHWKGWPAPAGAPACRRSS